MNASGNTKRRNEILKLPYLVLIVSLLVTLGATYFFYQNSQIKDKTRFATEVDKSKTIIENKLNNYMAMLKSTRAYIEADSKIDREKFAVFAKNLEVENSYAGIKGLGYIEAVSPDQRRELVEKMNADGTPDFKIYPESSENEKQYVVVYLEPLTEKNRESLGYDMASEAAGFAALGKARDSGKLSASGRIDSPRSGEFAESESFMFLPIYKGREIPQNTQDRKRLLKGFVYNSFRIADFLDDVQKKIASNYLAVSVFDGEKKPENIFARTAPGAAGLFSMTNEINVADRKWIVEYNSLPEFEAQSSTNLTPLIFISGIVFSLLLFGMTFLESSARANSEKVAANLSESESEKARLLESERKARENAEKANHVKDEFIANISHELRTPLNSIGGWSRILQAEDLSPPIKKQALQTIEKNLRTQTKIIEDLIDFAQITSGDKDISVRAVRFSDIFEEALQEIAASAEEKGIIIEKRNYLNGQEVCGDYPRLKRVIKNLLSNAVKFTPEGGKVTAETKENRRMLELSIRDNGQGIAPSFLPHIFEHFKQADSSITRRHGGLGMGLTISRQIIESHGGKIEAESEGKGKGSLFTVTLPILPRMKNS